MNSKYEKKAGMQSNKKRRKKREKENEHIIVEELDPSSEQSDS